MIGITVGGDDGMVRLDKVEREQAIADASVGAGY